MQRSLIKKINSIMPILTSKSYKGENGRIGVIGGSYQFTGAPFYSAISALKAGADLAHIFCSRSSSVSIKSYSPEIIVHPVFISEEQHKFKKQQLPQIYQQWIEKIKSWEKAVHCWVIGPGLGRDPYMHEFFPLLIKNIAKDKIIIFDADGIYYLAQHPQVFSYLKYSKTIITPNHKQLSFIKPFLSMQLAQDLQQLLKRDDQSQNSQNKQRQSKKQQIIELPQKYKKLHDYSLLIKNHNDIFLSSSSLSYMIRTPGGHKRCGGIGDILAGVTSVCSLWNYQLGSVLASRIVRKATNLAYIKQGRSLTAPSIIKELPGVVKQIQKQNQEG